MPRAAAAPLPLTTGKSAGAENFPVASLLLPAAMRGRIMAFYRIARAADDIADDPGLAAEDKLARLDAIEDTLRGFGSHAEAAAFRRAVDGDEILVAHALRLLDAFRRDAVCDHCRDWSDLLAYCRFSAVPVGRFLLDLHGEGPKAHAAADSLCAAHQILNHIQDCGTDYRVLGRVYIPRDWLLAHGASGDMLAADCCCAELHQVLDQLLDAVDGLIELARPLPSLIGDRRLRIQAAITIAVAEKLSARLRTADPLAGRVALSPPQYAGAFLAGITRSFKAA